MACGTGRHALWLAERGLTVDAIDLDPSAITVLEGFAEARGLKVGGRIANLEADRFSLGTSRYDVIVVVHYLHRPLFPALIDALREGGLLVYETFTRAQASIGRPTNPDFLLEPGELAALVQPLTIIHAREGYFDRRFIASVVARKER